jgi:putative DNA primase/helicase
LDWALLYVAAGLSVIPIRPDGSKAPALPRWKQYQERLPTSAELEQWFGGGIFGIAVLAGRVSGNLEILDFDAADTFLTWSLQFQLKGGDLTRFPRVATPGGGTHLYYRLRFPPPGNRKLAEALVWDPVKGRQVRKCLIETRGEGGYVVAPGSPATCHVSGRPYVFAPGQSLPPIPILEGTR